MINLWSGGEGLDHRSTEGGDREWLWAGQPATDSNVLSQWFFQRTAGWHQGGEIGGRILQEAIVYSCTTFRSHSEEEVEPGDSFPEGVHGMHYLRS